MNMSYIDILDAVKEKNAHLIAVSKTKPITAIKTIYDEGQRDFGENRIQELIEKHNSLPTDIKWHMIGSLQTNKVKYIAPWIHLIHSADRPSIIKAINDEGKKIGRKIAILLQIKIAKEDAKKGFFIDDLFSFLNSDAYKSYNNIEIKGVMGMASFVEDYTIVRNEFIKLKSIYDNLKNSYFSDSNHFTILSMGMSGDYKIALEEGATMIRVGSAIFGKRN